MRRKRAHSARLHQGLAWRRRPYSPDGRRRDQSPLAAPILSPRSEISCRNPPELRGLRRGADPCRPQPPTARRSTRGSLDRSGPCRGGSAHPVRGPVQSARTAPCLAWPARRRRTMPRASTDREQRRGPPLVRPWDVRDQPRKSRQFPESCTGLLSGFRGGSDIISVFDARRGMIYPVDKEREE